MFSRIKSFVYRHRRKFIVSGVIVGGAIFLSRYVQRTLREWQERETKELLERTRKQQHYESIERTCNQTVLTLTPSLKDAINKILQTKELIDQLQSGAPDRVSVWEEVKILSFAKIASLIYASSLLVVTLRIQLNIVGGYMFRGTVDEPGVVPVTSSLQEIYLSMCQYFIENGSKKLCDLIVEKVRLILQERSLKEKLNLPDIEQIFWSVQSSVSNDERDPCKNFLSYVLPDISEHDLPSPQARLLDKMILETKDLMESQEIVSLTGSCISRGFSYIMDQLAEFYGQKELPNGQGDLLSKPGTSSVPEMSSINLDKQKDFTNLTKISIPMAKVIPILHGLVQNNNHNNKNDVCNLWTQQLIFMDTLKVLGANVYETFSNKD